MQTATAKAASRRARARVAPRAKATLLLGTLALLGAGPPARAAGESASPAPPRWAERVLPDLGCLVVCPVSWKQDEPATPGSTAPEKTQPTTDPTDPEPRRVVRLGPPGGSVRASVRRLAGRRDLKAIVERLQAAQQAAGWTAARPPVRGMLAGYDAVWFTVTIPAAGANAPALTQRICAIDTRGACFVLTYGASAARYRARSATRFVESFTLAPAGRAGEATASSPQTGSDADPAPGTQTTAEAPDPAPRYGCPKCDLDHPKSASYCSRCGGPLGTLPRWGCRRCRLVAPKEDRFCTRCGGELERW